MGGLIQARELMGGEGCCFPTFGSLLWLPAPARHPQCTGFFPASCATCSRLFFLYSLCIFLSSSASRQLFTSSLPQHPSPSLLCTSSVHCSCITMVAVLPARQGSNHLHQLHAAIGLHWSKVDNPPLQSCVLFYKEEHVSRRHHHAVGVTDM